MQYLLTTASTVTVFLCYAVYIHAMLTGKAKPNRMTRFVMFVITAVATASLLAQNSQTTIWLLGTTTFFSFLMLLFSLFYGMGGAEKLDILCLIMALIGIFFWLTTKDPLYALFASIIADFIGMIPTLKKTYLYPHTEVWYFNFIASFASVFTLAALPKWTVAEISYPIYLVIINYVMVILVLRRKNLKLLNI